MPLTCQSLADVRRAIDRVDDQLVQLIAERCVYVAQAAGFKRDANEIPAPARVESVIARVCQRARIVGADPAVVESTWRAMIAASIRQEAAIHAELAQFHPPSP